MRLHALTLALCVYAACAATIPEKTENKYQKTLTQAVKEVLIKIDKEQASYEQPNDEQNIVKDVENKKETLEDIPVKVVVEDVISTLQGDQKDELKIVPDLKHPGPPQRQEHDSQSPEHFEDAKLKQAVSESQAPAGTPVGSGGGQFGVQWNWIHNNQQIQKFQQSLKDLQENFNQQVATLSGIITSVVRPQQSNKPVETAETSNNVRAVPVVKQESSTTNTNNSTNWLQQFQSTFQNMQNQWQQFQNQWSNFTTQFSNNSSDNNSNNLFQNWGIQNIINQGNNVSSDEPVKPTIWQNIQGNIQGFLQGALPPQNAQADTPVQTTPNRPIVQAFQNVVGLLQGRPPSPGEPAKPVQQTQQTQEGSNVVPAVSESKPEEQQKEPETATLPAQTGPIRQIIGNNPIVQSIATTVQRIQHTIVPERPRDTIKTESKLKPDFGHVHKPPVPGDNIVGVINNDALVKGEPEVVKPDEVPEKDEKAPVAEGIKTE